VQLAAAATAALDEDALLEALLALEEQGGPPALGYDLQAQGAEVWGAYADLEALQDGLRSLGFAVTGWEHRWFPQTTCPLGDATSLPACLRMLDVLKELDDVVSVTSNLEAEEALLEQLLG